VSSAPFGPEATLELEEAARWYEDRRTGLGLAFLAAVDGTIESILRWPRSGSLIDNTASFEVRRAPIPRFPYHLAYLVSNEDILVLAVAHDRRRPKYWSGRIPA
jgi:plasmid stabilization system protein ParE